MNTRILVLVLLVVVSGCGVNVTFHDEDRAAKIVEELLHEITTDGGVQNVYREASDAFRSNVSFDEFSKYISFVRSSIQSAVIKIVGYETFGPREWINVYAQSEAKNQVIYYRFGLVGTMIQGYKLQKIDIHGAPFDKRGVYAKYGKPIEIAKGIRLERGARKVKMD